MNQPTRLDDRLLLDLLLAEEGIERSATAEIRRDESTPPPLSRAQRRLWFLQQAAPDSPAYNVLSVVRLSGALHVAAVAQTLAEIVRRHAVLRSCFPTVEGRPTVQVLPEFSLQPTMFDLRGLPPDQQQQEVCRHALEESARPFDLEQGPLLRVRLLRLDLHQHVVILATHHIVTDAWSMGVFVTEFSTLYSEFSAGKPSPLPELEIQYGDFARWQEQWLSGPESAEQLAWWKEKLAGVTPLELPTDRGRPAEPTFQGATHGFAISPTLATAVKALARQEDATLFMTLLAAFSVLLHRYCQQDDIIVGTPIANRNRRELDPLIGFFVNSLVMRSDLSGHPDFRTVLRRARAFAMEAYARQDLPFDVLVNEIVPDRGDIHNPLFQVMFAVENAPAGRLDLTDLTIETLEVNSNIAKFDLLLNISDVSDELVGVFEYSTELFDAETIERMAGNFLTLLESIVRDPDQSVATLGILNAAERQRTLVQWNQIDTAYPRDACIHELFERQARQCPDQVAVEFQQQRLTYAELNARANQLAHHLRGLGVGAEKLVGLCVERSVEMVVGMLAILKAGAAYVPLDPEYPQERLRFLLDDMSSPVVVTLGHLAQRLPAGDTPIVRLDADWPSIALGSRQNLACDARGDAPAYVIYTSGSTGEPKGVTVPHRAVGRLVRETDYIHLQADDRVAQASTPTFDAATFEIWGALLNGACLVGVERNVTLDPVELAAFLRAERITTLFLTTALFNQIAREAPDAFHSLRHVLFGGELVDPHWVREVLRNGPPRRLLHVYGPTENTTFSTWYLVRDVPADARTVPIGGAIANTSIYVLDGNLQPVPIGVPGELYVGGDGLALGYLNQAELTAQTFLANPFEADDDSKLYKTGDRVRWLPGGEIEFLGRRDNQVKIRGFRIEPGEIESVLVRLPEVREAVVLVREDQPGRRELVAYVAASHGARLDAPAARKALADRMPDYMVPAKFVFLDELPLNANGKFDRARLPAPEQVPAESRDEFQPPRNELEECLVKIWQDVLRHERVGIHDNYFELGGDSITAIQVVSRLKRAGWKVKVAELFRDPTIAQLAPCLKPDQAAAEVVEAVGEIPLTAVQCWFFEHYRGQRHHFNQSALLRAHEPLDVARLQAALTQLQTRHDALRLTFEEHDGTPVQIGHAARDQAALDVIDLRDEPEIGAALELRADEIQRGIDLRHGPLWKSALFRCPDGDRLLLVIHHLAVDGVSWRILLEDLQLAYQNLDLGATTSSFREWAEQVQRLATSDELGDELPYWSTVEQANTTLPINDAGTANHHGVAQTVHEYLSAEETTLLLTSAHRAHQTEIMDLLLTALGRALKHWTGSADTLITLEGHGREFADESLELTRTPGWFTSLYPFVVSVADDDLGSQVLRVKEDLRRIPNKGAGYGILRYVAGHPLASNPRISFNYLGKFDQAGADGGLFEFSDEPSGTNIAGDLERAHELDFVCLVGRQNLVLSLEFNPLRLPVETAAGLLADFKQQLQSLIEHCHQFVERNGSTSRRLETATAAGETRPLPSDDARENWREIAGRVAAGEIEDCYPLSPMQEGLLFQALYEPDDTAYFVQTTHRIRGPLRADAFQECWRVLSQRHVVLRSAFVHEGLERPLQVALKSRPPEFQIVDLRGLSAAETDRRIELFRNQERSCGFDLQRDVLLRVALFRREEELYELVLSYHHIVLDGWCLGILHRELMEAYRSLCRDSGIALPPVQPLRRYVNWLQQRDPEEARRFWADYTTGYEQTATLPQWQIGAIAGGRREKYVTLDENVTESLKQLAARAGVTMNTAVQCLWGLLLFRYNQVDDVIFGAIVSGRPSELDGVEDMVGVFINAVPVRIRCSEQQSFVDLLKAVQLAALDAQPHAYLPLAEIQSASTLGRGLFDHLLVFENHPRAVPQPDEEPDPARLNFELIDLHDYTHYDLTVTIDVGASLEFRIAYRHDVYAAAQIDRLAQHLDTVARNVVERPEQAALDVSILPDEECREVVHRYNATAHRLPASCTVVELFEQQVDRVPDAVALTGEHGQTTYAELDAWANRLALRLREQGVQENDRVGISLPRDERLVVAILAVLKSGAAYVPLDPDHPAQRTRYIVADSRCKLVLTPDDVGDPVGPKPALRPKFARPGNLAYVIYTSGSTGQPKGCQIEHESLLNYLTWANRSYFQDDGEGSFGLFTSMSFDMTVTSFYLPLIRGRTLRLFSQQADIAEVLAENLSSETPIDCLKLTPSHISLIAHLDVQATNVGLAIVGGEALQREQVAILRRLNPAMRIHNEYGPTEATVGCICKEIGADDARITIGRPIDNTQIYIMDHRLRPAPVGVTGEIYIAGKCLSRGYLDRDDLNQRAFVDVECLPAEVDPTREAPTDSIGRRRMYKTGDLARWLPGGEIEYLGRNDDQVKVRGFRVELGEVEACLVEHPGVAQAAVLCRPAVGGGSELVAYVAGQADLETAALRRWLADRLPEQMVPSFFVTIDSLPRATSGKVDRRALAHLADSDATRSTAYRSAETPLQVALVGIWQTILRIDTIGVDDNFFELGGHSLKAMQVVAQVRKQLDAEIRIRDVFEHPTVAGLAAIAATVTGANWSDIPAAPVQEYYELSHAQERLWLLHQMDDAAAYNMPEAYAFDQTIDIDALRRAFDALIRRHETLRTRFVQIGGEPKQEILETIPFSVDVVDFRGRADAAERAREVVEQLANEPFDLTRPPLFRTVVVRLRDDRFVFALAMHHIIGDGWSMQVFYQELLTLYGAYRDGDPDPLEPLRIHYKDFAAWQNAKGFEREEKYWLARLAGAPECLPLPYDRSPEGNRDFRGDAKSLVLDANLTGRLRSLARQHNTTLSNVVLTLFKLGLYQWTGQDDICVGMGIANRHHPDLENLIGFFVNVLPIRTRFSDDMEFDELLRQVIDNTYEAFEHQDYPFDLLTRRLNPTRYANRQPIFNVLYAFQNFSDVHIDNPLTAPAPIETDEAPTADDDWALFEFSFATSKFDLTLFVIDEVDTLHLCCEYDTRQFLEGTIQRQLEKLRRFAEAATSQLGQSATHDGGI